MLSLRVRPVLARVVDPVAAALLRAGVSPDAITVLGTVGVVTGALAFFPRGQLFVGTMVVTAFVLTDMLDGAMARRIERRSVFGAWLDSTCDRLADAAVFSGLVLWLVGDGDDVLLAGVALFCLVAGSLVSYAKARAEGLGLRCDVGFAERAERLIIVLVAAGFSGLGVTWALPVGLWALAVASAVTVVQRLLEVRRQAAAAVR
ncbi:MAG: Phosphatidylinositol phosphate synthase @ Archaetidylinositol phosphate synthase [uncultured Frankineae bacterium]|uniref:Phosphatidylinositol phosphate synthase n=1 Tax=uncultured Frankineae bacterium TaxID=437475 RepID=A0A6J4M4B3_9ACTN|nr:MAG: Phosphatidylinositol phosphate synthase @ Archaetidylinositol phosphate synthase [uncultured Frankineae bacterium]